MAPGGHSPWILNLDRLDSYTVVSIVATRSDRGTNVDDECRAIAVADLHEPFIVMRPVVKDSVEYLERRDSLARFGPLNSILTRPSTRTAGKFEVIDGNWRFNAAQDIGRESLPCIIKHGLSDDDALAIQIHANAVRTDTTPLEYSKQLRRIIDATGGTMTFTELARIAGKHPAWVKDRLGLLELSKPVQLMVDRGEIPALSAYMLAKIPSRWRADYVDHARAMTAAKFCPLAAGVIKQFRECVQQGKMDERYLPDFKPQHYMRGLREVKDELDSPQVGAMLLVTMGCKTMLDGWNACLKWVLHLDPAALEEQRQNATRKARTQFQETEADNEPLTPP